MSTLFYVSGAQAQGGWFLVRPPEDWGMIAGLMTLKGGTKFLPPGQVVSPADIQRAQEVLNLQSLEEDVSAINALTLVGSAAKFFGAEFDRAKIEKHVKDCYGFLSEFWHPNLFARKIGVSISHDLRIVEFDPAFTLDRRDLHTCFSHGHASHALFLNAYDKCVRLLEEHEEMPTLEA